MSDNYKVIYQWPKPRPWLVRLLAQYSFSRSHGFGLWRSLKRSFGLSGLDIRTTKRTSAAYQPCEHKWSPWMSKQDTVFADGVRLVVPENAEVCAKCREVKNGEFKIIVPSERRGESQ